MLKSYGVGWVGWGGVVAHVILVSAQVLLVLTLGLWTSDLGLTIIIHGIVIGGLQVPPVSCWTTPRPWSCCTPCHILAWMGIGDHSETVLLLALFDQSTLSCLKVMGWGGGVGGGGPCDYSVSPWSKSFFFPF